MRITQHKKLAFLISAIEQTNQTNQTKPIQNQTNWTCHFSRSHIPAGERQTPSYHHARVRQSSKEFETEIELVPVHKTITFEFESKRIKMIKEMRLS